MDREAVSEKMKGLKQKAKQARKAGGQKAAASFRSGMKRLQRQLKATAPKERTRGKKKED